MLTFARSEIETRNLVQQSAGRFLRIEAFLAALILTSPCLAQNNSKEREDVPEMLLTAEGLLAIDTPKGWVRSEGPGLAFFLREGANSKGVDVWIYISSAPVGPREEAKNVNEYIESDIAGFRERFKNGTVQKEEPIDLPHPKIRVPVYTFQSAEKNNAFERIVYIGEINRVLILAVSAKNKNAFANSLPDFERFAKSYRGSIVSESSPK